MAFDALGFKPETIAPVQETEVQRALREAKEMMQARGRCTAALQFKGRVCVLGALGFELKNFGYRAPSETAREAARLFGRVAQERCAGEPDPIDACWEINDHPDTTDADLYEVFEEAYRRAGT